MVQLLGMRVNLVYFALVVKGDQFFWRLVTFLISTLLRGGGHFVDLQIDHQLGGSLIQCHDPNNEDTGNAESFSDGALFPCPAVL